MIHPRKDPATAVATLLVVVIVLALLLCIALVSLTYHQLVLDGRWTWASEWLRNADAPTRSSALGQLGDYFGGTLNPILSFCGFLVLLVTVVLQRRQLEEGTRQLAQSTRAIDLEAFVRVNDILQTAEGIAARERLYVLTQTDGLGATPFDRWTPDDKKAAEAVCRQFELVGLLVAGSLFDPGLFLQSWQNTVHRCWSACQQVVHERRARQDDPGLWRHFESLAGMAQLWRSCGAD
jgi:hypothetical protein